MVNNNGFPFGGDGKSPAFVDAKDGYETRLVAQLNAAVANANALAGEVQEAIASRARSLLLEEENRELRKLLGPNACVYVSVVASTSGDVVVDVVKAVASEMEARGFASHHEVRSTMFIDAVRRRLRERPVPTPAPTPKEDR